MVSVRHPRTPRTNRHDKGRTCLQVESSASQLIRDTFSSFSAESLVFPSMSSQSSKKQMPEKHLKPCLTPGTWLHGCWTLSSLPSPSSAEGRRTNQALRVHLVEECIKLCSLWTWDGLDSSCLGNEQFWTLVSDSLSTCRDSLLCISA